VYASSGINADGQIVIKVVNPTNDAKNIPVSISNSAKKYTKVHAEVITGELHDTNSFEQPLKVAPVGSDSEITGNDFNYQFAPRSITVLRLTPSK
jgi:alpha-L-arabinofuranosidase